MKPHIRLSLAILTISASAFSKDLSFSIRANPQSVQWGEHITFTFIYTNTSDHDLGIIPEYYAYQALDIHLTKVDGSQIGEMIPYLTPYIDPNLARRNFRLLKPGKTYNRQLTVTFSSVLPKSVKWPARTPGAYLLFADSAIKLPGLGKYKATSRYLGVEAYRKQLANPDKSRLWLGKLFAPSIIVEFRER
jgi:hypothetical protein